MKLTNDNDPVAHFKASCATAAAALIQMGDCLSRIIKRAVEEALDASTDRIAVALERRQFNRRDRTSY